MGVRAPMLAISCFLAGCATTLSPDDALTTIPCELQPGGRIAVGVRINEQGPFRFVVDTAATASFLFARTQAKLGLEPVPDVMATVHGAIASGRFPAIDVDRLGIGDVIWPNARLIALPAEASGSAMLDGILGADFLRRYAVGFSTRDRVIRLYRPETISQRSTRGWRAIAIESRTIGSSVEPLHFLDIEVAGRRIPALLDLGAGISLLNPAAATALRLAPTRTEQAGQFSGAIGSERVFARLGSQAVRTDGVRWNNELFMIADLDIFRTLDYGDRPLAILGSGLFTQRDFIIDFARNRLLVKGSMPESDADATSGVTEGAGDFDSIIE
jgi:predicted aspartyl protease